MWSTSDTVVLSSEEKGWLGTSRQPCQVACTGPSLAQLVYYCTANDNNNRKVESDHDDGKQRDRARGGDREMGIQGKHSGDNLIATNLLYLPVFSPYSMPGHSIKNYFDLIRSNQPSLAGLYIIIPSCGLDSTQR